MLMIAPAPLCFECGRQALTQMERAVEDDADARRASRRSDHVVERPLRRARAALLTRMSMRPKRSTVAARHARRPRR